ncbi:MAG: hypothetical protein KBS41_04385 [Oscillospiraceae bacterium]|nr:hypothetical protein [Candidatus Equicaccousia limihippi]
MLTVAEINKFAKEPKSFIELTEKAFTEKVHDLVLSINEKVDTNIILICGPSSSGKTTQVCYCKKNFRARVCKAI